MKTIQNPKHYKISKMSFFRFLAILAFSGVGARADQAGAAFGFAASLPMFAPLVLASFLITATAPPWVSKLATKSPKAR